MHAGWAYFVSFLQAAKDFAILSDPSESETLCRLRDSRESENLLSHVV
jgi:hypothetical protein